MDGELPLAVRAGRALGSLVVLAGIFLSGGEARASRYDYAWPLPEWRATWSAPGLADNRGFAVEATADGVWVAGVTGSHGRGAGDLFLLRYDLDGQLRWWRTWGGFELDQAQGLAVDGGGAWVAGSHTTEEGRPVFALLRFDLEGTLVAERTWARGVLDVLQGLAADAGAVYVAGLTHRTRTDRDLYAARLNPDGSLVWELTVGGSDWDEAWDVALGAGVLYVAGYTTDPATGTSQALLLLVDPDTGLVRREVRWGEEGNDEARALALAPEGLYVAGAAQRGRSTDVALTLLSPAGELVWTTTTGGRVVGGGGYGVAVGSRGVYVAGGTYDFPAGGDAALLRFSRQGELEWSYVLGSPGFWDWAFDVDARAGRFYVTGVLWRPGPQWYSVLTAAFREEFPTASLTGVAAELKEGDHQAAARALEHFSPGDFLRWAQGLQATDPGRSWVAWEGASDAGRAYGQGWADTGRQPPVGEENTLGALGGLGEDLRRGNYALVRDYVGVRGSLLDGFVRFRYYVSHDRLIPQGGYLYVGEFGLPLPPPPV